MAVLPRPSSGPVGEPAAPAAASPALMTGPPPFPPQSRVTLANWQDPPFNRWAFQHVRELIPNARFSRGDGLASPLPRAGRDVLDFRFRSADRELTVAELLAETYTDGFLVLHQGQVVAEHYFNGLAPDVPHLLMSVSKSVTAAVAGILAGRGLLRAGAAVQEIVPELGGTSLRGATVQDLLDMRAGTRFDESYDNPESDVRTYERVYLWRPDDGQPRPPDALGYFATLQNDGAHGGPFRYRSILTDVLAWVLERAAGARLHQLIAGELWQPMGAEFDAEITVDGRGNPMADGGICATLRDLGRFGQLYRGAQRLDRRHDRGRTGRRPGLRRRQQARLPARGALPQLLVGPGSGRPVLSWLRHQRPERFRARTVTDSGREAVHLAGRAQPGRGPDHRRRDRDGRRPAARPAVGTPGCQPPGFLQGRTRFAGGGRVGNLEC